MAVMKSLDDCSSYFVDSIVSVGEAGWDEAGESGVRLVGSRRILVRSRR
jgi:hypothetical protein